MRIRTLILALLGLCLTAGAASFKVLEDSEANRVHFHSEATLESFDGETRAITGTIGIEEGRVDAASTAFFEVDLRELRTGIKKRDGHMRDNHLHTDKFPMTSFTMTGVSGEVELKDGVPVDFTASGDFLLHGMTQERQIPVTVTWHADGSGTPAGVSGSVIHVQSKFPVALAEHDIPRPEFLFMKMASTIDMTLDFWAAAE